MRRMQRRLAPGRDRHCEVHAVDLCPRHMRKHFDRATCRLVPVEREPTEWDRTVERVLG
jgi:hypothetical protein